jgi:hypothetical protein
MDVKEEKSRSSSQSESQPESQSVTHIINIIKRKSLNALVFSLLSASSLHAAHAYI